MSRRSTKCQGRDCTKAVGVSGRCLDIYTRIRCNASHLSRHARTLSTRFVLNQVPSHIQDRKAATLLACLLPLDHDGVVAVSSSGSVPHQHERPFVCLRRLHAADLALVLRGELRASTTTQTVGEESCAIQTSTNQRCKTPIFG